MTAAKAVWAAVLSFLAPAAAILLIEVAGDGIQSGRPSGRLASGGPG